MHLTNCSIWTLQITVVETVLIQVNHRRHPQSSFVVIVVAVLVFVLSCGHLMFKQLEPVLIQINHKGHPESSFFYVDTDDSINLQNSDESDQDDTGWEDSVSQFGMQFYDKAPYVRSPVDNRAKERDYFRLLFSNDIVENLVEQTNLYATQPKTKTVLCRGTRVHKTLPCQNWTPVTKAEIEAFIGICILMAIHQLPEIQHY